MIETTTLICGLVAICNGFVAHLAFSRGEPFWGWMNLIFSAANTALVLKALI
jgi:hypothetical protein